MDNKKFVNPNYLEPHYSTKFFRAYFNYLGNNYSKTVFFSSCEELGMPTEYLMADGNWVSNQFLIDFLEKLKAKTGDPRIAENVGATLLTTDNINPFEHALLSIMPPLMFFASFPFNASKVNRWSKYKMRKLRPGRLEYEIQSAPEHPHSADVCANAIGFLGSAKSFYQLNDQNVAHPKCIHRGDRECIFTVEYSAKTYLLKRFFLLLALICGALFTFSFFTGGKTDSSVTGYVAVLAFVFGIAFFTTLVKLKNIFRFHTLHYEQSRTKEQVLFESKVKLDRRYQELNLMRDLSLKLVKLNNSKEVIESCLNDLEQRFGYERAIVLLIDSSNSKLYTVDVRGFGDNTEMLFKLNFKYPAEKENPQFFANILEKGETELITNIEAFKKGLEANNQLLLMAFGVKCLIVAPIQDATTKYGLLVIGSFSLDRNLNEDDKHLIENITRMLSLFFQNAQNFEKERTLKLLFQRYVPRAVMDGIKNLQSGGAGVLTPRSNAVTSIFIDLRNFTSVSENLAPENVVEMLNLYIEYVTKLIAYQGGIVDNLVGDGIVAFFPANSLERTEHARHGLKCAINILGNLNSLNKKMKEKGYPPARLGIGLHSGNATVGNLGSDVRTNYTAIGDTVNLASRLESLTKEFSDRSDSAAQGMIIFSEAVLNRAGLDVSRISLGRVKVKGRSDAVEAFMIDKAMAESIDIDLIPNFEDRDASHLEQKPKRRTADQKNKKPA